VYVIGLTGGIASGKSTAAHCLASLGARVLDADRLGHRTYEPGGPAYDAVVEAFGGEVVAADGAIDRTELGRRVFASPEERRRLCAIVWPEIRKLVEAELEALERGTPGAIVVLEAAVLLEAGWEDLVDEVWVLRVSPEIAVARLVARNGLDPAQARARLAAQLSDAERVVRAQRVFSNEGSPQELEQALRREWPRLCSRANSPLEGSCGPAAVGR